MAASTSDQGYSIFVGDLAQDVHDQYLEQFFRTYFVSVKGAKVIMDPATGRSRGYGFVRFGSEEDRDRALKEMNGVFISTRPVRVSLATSKKPGEMGGAGGSSAPRPAGGSGGAGEYIATGDDPNNTTIFLGNLSPYVTEELLRSTFARFGEIVYTKIPPGKGCGFVQFTDRRTAEYAMSEMQGQYVGSSPVRISWGKTSTKTPGAGAAGTAGRPAAAVGAYPGYGGYDASAYQYGAYDPYGMAYSGYGDPYAAYYGAPAYPQQVAPPAGAGAAGDEARPSGPTQIYDPLAPISVDKMNNIFIHRHMPVLTGSCMRIKINHS